MKTSLSRTTPNHPRDRQQGIAVVTVLIMLVLVATLVSITSILAVGNRRASTDTVMGSKAQYAAEAGIENAVYQVFYRTQANWAASADATVVGATNPKFDSCAFKKWVTGKWNAIVHSADMAVSKNNNSTNCSYILATANVTNPTFPNLFNDNAAHPTATETSQGLYSQLNKTLESSGGSVTGYRTTLRRQDRQDSEEVNIAITTTGFVSVDGKEVAVRTLEQIVKITSQAYQGDRFALLTNATNCSFCHLHIDTMQRVYADPTGDNKYFNRARVAVLTEDLNLDPAHDGDTFIAGTLYARKNVNGTAAKEVYSPEWTVDSAGNLLEGYVKAGPTFGSEGIRGKPFGHTAPGDKAVDAEVIDAASEVVYSTYGTKGTKTKFGKIYKNYPTENQLKTEAKYGGQWPDGPVPDTFPSVIPEDPATKDGLVSDAEWATYTQTAARGTLSGDEDGDGINDTQVVVYGVRRPSSSVTRDANIANVPISYDPVRANAALYTTTLEGRNLAQNDAGFLTQLNAFLSAMRTNNVSDTRSTSNTVITNFVTDWKGWLIQQALASPNNRDLEPGVPDLAAAGTQTIAWPPVNGTARNNFWVNYNPTSNPPYLTLRYRDTGAGGSWFDCATQNSTCSFVGVGQVRFGAENQSAWRAKNNTKNVTCTVSGFGGDPAPGITKQCEYQSGSSWIWCAAQGSSCSSGTNRNYRFGTPSATLWSTPLTFTNSASCNTATFGDPWSGVTKKCQVLLSQTERVISVPLTDADVFPTVSNDARLSLKNGYWDGNVIINAGRIGDTGSARRTVTINGNVYVNGDVVIRGQVKGRGRIVARGNIYVVGDLVYGCGDHACRIEDVAGLPSYRNWRQLPLLGLLAGNNVLVGDYDYPDYRAASASDFARRSGGVFDLINDQVGRDTGDSTGNTGITKIPNGTSATNSGGTTSPWPYYAVPGSTGTNSASETSAGDMGFVPMSAANSNWKNRSGSTYLTGNQYRYFQSGPFGLIVGRSGFGSYETSNAAPVTNLGNSSVIPLYPSNGPLQVGGNTTQRGFYMLPGTSGSQLAANLSCSGNGANGTVNHVVSTLPKRFKDSASPSLINYSFGFYCAPFTSNAYLRNWTYGTTNPGQDTNAWMLQSPQSRGLDGGTNTTAGVGMSTGWLGGLLGQDASGNFRQTGDLSQTRLLKLMWLSTIEYNRDLNPLESGNQAGPLRTDGIFYSAHSIFSLARVYRNTFQDARSQTEGRWIHNGSVVASELGFLITGDYTTNSGGTSTRYTVNRTSPIDFRPSSSIQSTDIASDPDAADITFSSNLNLGAAMGIYYDERLAGFLGLTNGNPVQIERSRGYRQVAQ